MQEEEPEAVEPVGSRSMTAMSRCNFLSLEPFSPFSRYGRQYQKGGGDLFFFCWKKSN